MRGEWSMYRAAQCRNRQLQGWLREPGSLTARCESACREFRISLLSYRCEARRGKRWIREVLLECDGRPVVFAQSELLAAPRGRLLRWLAGLGSRSLGSLLFSFPGFGRGEIEYCRLDVCHPLFRRAVQASGLQGCRELWARRSRHWLAGQSVLVTEVFLPNILLLG